MTELGEPLSDYKLAMSASLTDGDFAKYSLVLGAQALYDLVESSEEILDIGPGVGSLFAQDVDRNWLGCKKVINLSPQYSVAMRGSIMPNIMSVAGLGQDLPLRDKSFGGVISVQAVPKFVPFHKLDHTLAEIYRVLKPGGTGLLWPAIAGFDNKLVMPIREISHAYMNLEMLEPDVCDELNTGYSSKRIVIKKPLAIT